MVEALTARSIDLVYPFGGFFARTFDVFDNVSNLGHPGVGRNCIHLSNQYHIPDCAYNIL